MGEATWVVRTDVKNPWIVGRHRAGESGRPTCNIHGAWDGVFREIEADELGRYRACGKCVPAEHDGPYESANEAAERLREAATAVAYAAIALSDLGYKRMAISLRGLSENLFASADRAEVES